MLVEKTSSHFIFQTVTSNKYGTHPEYGTREFGFESRKDGSIKFYTRGLSRPGSPRIGLVGKIPQYIGWTSLMEGISNEIKRRGGKVRPSSLKSWTTHKSVDQEKEDNFRGNGGTFGGGGASGKW